MKNVIYGYRELGYTGNYVCVRVNRPDKDIKLDLYQYPVSWAFCSNIDQFSRPKARRLVDDRMNDSDASYVIVSDVKLGARELIEKALDYNIMQNTKHLPPWVYPSAKWHKVSFFKNKVNKYGRRFDDWPSNID